MDKIEYIRKNGGMSVKIESEDNSEPRFIRVSKGEKKGVLFCGVHPEDPKSVVIGFSLCNKMDKFDVVNGKKRNGFGLEMATKRAVMWSNHIDYFIQRSWTEEQLFETEPLGYFVNPNPKEVVEIPPSIAQQLQVFIERCKKYYKDKEFPVWTENIRMGKPYADSMDIEIYDFCIDEMEI
jgi:hypothetical protein